jgi:hypothetical protein
MAVQKTILKNENQRAVVHLYASAAGDTTSIALTELLNSHQTTSATTALTVNIAYAYNNISGSANSSIIIRRGNSTGTVVLTLYADSEFPGGQQLPALAISNTSSIHVTWETQGIVILDLRKVAGYDSPNYNVGV